MEEALAAARSARDAGRDALLHGRGVARRSARTTSFDAVLEMVRGVRALGMEACCTLGMLTQRQADALADAGLTAYNHNLDTSPEFYGEIITTRTYEDRLDDARARAPRRHHRLLRRHHRHGRETARRATACCASWRRSIRIRKACRSICWCASRARRWRDQPPEDPLELVRMIATARILMPASMVRLSAGRLSLSDEAQALCFLAGRQLGLPGRQAADHAQSGSRRRPAAVRQTRHAAAPRGGPP